MQNDTQTAALEKAHSAAQHIARIAKAVTDFHQKLTKLHADHHENVKKLHKAHHDDMHEALGKLHKVLTGESAGDLGSASGGGPTATDLEGAGTHNIQDFGKALTPEAIQKMIADEIGKAFGSFVETLAKAANTCENCGKEAEKCECGKAQKTASSGVGDRTQATDSAVVVKTIAVPKSAEGQPIVASQPVSADVIQKAANGDQDAMLQVMKGVKPSEVPVVLTEALSKIH